MSSIKIIILSVFYAYETYSVISTEKDGIELNYVMKRTQISV